KPPPHAAGCLAAASTSRLVRKLQLPSLSPSGKAWRNGSSGVVRPSRLALLAPQDEGGGLIEPIQSEPRRTHHVDDGQASGSGNYASPRKNAILRHGGALAYLQKDEGAA